MNKILQIQLQYNNKSENNQKNKIMFFVHFWSHSVTFISLSINHVSYFNMLGGVQGSNQTAEDVALVASLTGPINAKIGHQHTSYEIVSVSTQVVAGTNKFYHIRGQPGNHEHTITVYIPLPHTGQPPQISEASCGFNPHQQGHSQNEHHHHGHEGHQHHHH